MGKRGIRPTPTALKLVQGSTRINDDEPIPKAGLPICPPSTDSELLEVWNYTLEQMRAMKIVTQADRDTLYAYCQAVINHRKASDQVAMEGPVVLGSMGSPIKHPALTVMKEMAQLMRQFAGEFGLTPSARTGIKVSAQTPDRETVDPARLLSG